MFFFSKTLNILNDTIEIFERKLVECWYEKNAQFRILNRSMVELKFIEKLTNI